MSVKAVRALVPFLLCLLWVDNGFGRDSVGGKTALRSDERPNILLVIADDLGYSDLGSFGGEISTPNLDELAREGIRLVNFHAGPTCSPTRSMIMSGTYSHRAGLGAMAEWTAENQKGQPGYEGFLNHRVAALPALLRDAGYYTFMAGKWHLGMKPEHGPQARGFMDSIAMLPGAGDHYSQRGINPRLKHIPYRENGRDFTLPDNFYSTDFYTDRAIAYIDKATADSSKPFFGYVAYTAPHWPLQVDPRYSDKYRGRYAAGYEALKRERLARMVEQGIVSAGVPAFSGSGCSADWDDLDEAEQQRQARLMEIYAGMVDSLDENVGRLINHLKSVGEYDNTLIVFISDNGADARPEQGLGRESQFIETTFDNSLENMGNPGSFVSYGSAWAEVGSVPFRLHKGLTTEGGIRVPAIVRLPASVAGQREPGVIRREFASVLDLMPTFLDLAEAPIPGPEYAGRKIYPIVGKSMTPYLSGTTDTILRNEPYGFSVHRRQGLQFDQWKIVRLPAPYGDYSWELYDLSEDPGETNNLAKSQPDVTAEMVARWDSFARETGVIIADPSSRSPAECLLPPSVSAVD
ncbi:arylsulfatase [Congregibacter variabilis]|uniref:Arylsulfatase n=1 Tax=Congregibacter variabilis TaxID=3081200 RepID=A0ABZ0HYR7_9GAMM|nr:arylsulfatase [Congregibacter sp. IMCC43200]